MNYNDQFNFRWSSHYLLVLVIIYIKTPITSQTKTFYQNNNLKILTKVQLTK